MYDEESLRLFAAVKAVCDPDNLLNPGVLVDPAPLDADLRPAPAARVGDQRAAAGPRRRLARRRRPPLHGGRQVRRARDDRRDVPLAPGDPRREGLDPRAGPGAAGGARRHARARARRPGRHRGARPLPVLQGLRRATARPASTWRRTRRRCCTSSTPAAGVRAATTRWAGCRAGRRWPRRWRAPANRLAGGPLGRLAKAAAGVDRRRSLPPFAPVSLRRSAGGVVRRGRGGARRRAAVRRTCGSGPTPSPTTSCRRPPRPRSGCWRTPG